jgi:hypothetical protein
VREHFGGGIFLARRKGIACGNDMSFGDRQRDAIGDRIGGRIGNRDAALALAASRGCGSCRASFTLTASTAFAFAACRAAFTRGDRSRLAASLTASFAARFAAARGKHPARKRSAEAELGPELERAVHRAGDPLHESVDYLAAHGGIDNHSQDAIWGSRARAATRRPAQACILLAAAANWPFSLADHLS